MKPLEVAHLRLSAVQGGAAVVDDTSLAVAASEIVGLVGESGAGKTTVGLAALGSARAGLVITGGTVRVDGVSLLELDGEGLRRLRGATISYMSQRPASALNPALTIRAQLESILHSNQRGVGHDDRVRAVCDEVAVPLGLLDRYPHQLSGGQLRRAALALALVCEPDVVVVDEPSAGLDADTASQALAAIRRRCDERGMAALWITHDLAMATTVTDRLYVMYAGEIVEEAATELLLADPAHPYTRHLLAASPDPTGRRRMVGLAGRAPDPASRPGGCQFAPRCGLVREECRHARPPLADAGAGRRVRCIVPFGIPDALLADRTPIRLPERPTGDVLLAVRHLSASFRGPPVVDDVTFDVQRGEWLALVGPSGSGKSTLLRAIAGIHRRPTGVMGLHGEPLPPASRERSAVQRRSVQLVPQHPFGAFNPRRTIGESVARPLRLDGVSRERALLGAREALVQVALDAGAADRYPTELSGGELQRAAIARALVGRPSLLLCDEITSSLDAVVQAAIVELLVSLRRELDLTIMFVTHDLALVAAVADRALSMADGRLVAVPSVSGA